MLTLTAPGTDERHLRWVHPDDLGRRRRRRCGCEKRLDPDLSTWNPTAGRRWNHLRTALAREHPGMSFLRAVEVQEGAHREDGAGRGAIHLHVLLWLPTPVDFYRVQALALAAGFGCNLQWSPYDHGSHRQAYYVAKYVSKGSDLRGSVPWASVDPATGEVTDHRPTYRTWSCSQGWGLRMRDIDAAVAAAYRRSRLLTSMALLGASTSGGPDGDLTGFVSADPGPEPPPT